MFQLRMGLRFLISKLSLLIEKVTAGGRGRSSKDGEIIW